MPRKNPTSPLRNGFDYQDLYSIYLCIDWFKNPNKYKWMKFETIPDEVDDNTFYLDDIIFSCSNGNYEFYQVKHKQNPETDKWDWENFLKRGRNKNGSLKESLLQKWFKSYFKTGLKSRITSAAFITNGLPSDEIKKCLTNNRLDLQQIEDYYPDIFKEISQQLGSTQDVTVFFSEFRFMFNQKELDELEAVIKSAFYRDLRATESGVISLLHHIHKEGNKRYTEPIIIDKLTEWCEWDKPKPLNQDFHVPVDFQLFNPHTHEALLSNFRNSDGGVQVIHGKPGSGKSTYLSNLYQVLKNEQTPVIRHHYHISTDEGQSLERLNSERVIEALKHEIKNFYSHLDDLANKNSKNVSLQEYLKVLANSFYQNGKALVLIIDGLDHVLRYSHENELQDFLKEICYPQKGLWIILGTQLVTKEYLPQAIFDVCREENWIEIAGFSTECVKGILLQNIIDLHLPEEENQIHDLSKELHAITSGNPLHLHYTLRQLKNRFTNKLITKFSFSELIPYGEGIEKYYDSLWRQLTDTGKLISYFISVANFMLKRNQITEIMLKLRKDLDTIITGIKGITHLLSEDIRGLSIYHSSFQLFLTNQRDYQEYNIPIKKQIIDWLECTNYDELKWSELRRLQYETGNSGPILELDKDWVIEALVRPRNPDRVIFQLELGAKAAFENRMFGKVFELSKLSQYYSNAINYLEDEGDKLWEAAVKSSKIDMLELDFSNYSSHKIYCIGRIAERQGSYEILDKTISLLNTRHVSMRGIMAKGEIGSTVPTLARYIISLVSLNRMHDVTSVHKYIQLYTELDWTSELYEIYTANLVETRQNIKLQQLLKSKLSRVERSSIIDTLSLLNLKLQKDAITNLINSEESDVLNIQGVLYQILHGQTIRKVPNLPSYGVFPKQVKEYETGNRKMHSKIFTENFMLGIVYGLTGKSTEVQIWIAQAERRWGLEVMSCLFESALRIADNISNSKTINCEELFEKLETVEKLVFPRDRNLLELQNSFRLALIDILGIVLALKSRFNSTSLTKEELIAIQNSKYLYHQLILEFFAQQNQVILSEEAYSFYIDMYKEYLTNRIMYFSERTKDYSNLARLSALHGDQSNQNLFLNRAASNIIGYGYHKDMYLDEVLNIIRSVAYLYPEKSKEWTRQIVPAIEYVKEYTDGDETNQFPAKLADVLSVVDKKLLYKYYCHKANKEELFLAEDIFKSIIKTMRFEREDEVLVAATAYDQGSLIELEKKIKESPAMEKRLGFLESRFRTNIFENNAYDNTLPSLKEEIDVSSVDITEVEEQLEKIEDNWKAKRFIKLWLKFKLKAAEINPFEIYKVMSTIIEKRGFHEIDSEVLDLLFPIAYEFDNEKAFEFLCWAQANEYGSGYYVAGEEKICRRWKLLKELYVERRFEFLEKSTARSGRRYGRGDAYFISIPCAVGFLKMFNELGYIEEIMEAAIKFTQVLMGDTKLPSSTWIEIQDSIDEIDLLFVRLTWPSPVVRESALIGIAQLLNSPTFAEITLEKFVVWLQSQKLESVIAYGILLIIKAVELGAKDIILHNLSRILDVVSLTSIVVQKLLEELVNLIGTSISIPNREGRLNEFTASYQINNFFNKYIQGFLPTIYHNNAIQISLRIGFDFMKQWSYTSDELVKELGIKEKAEEIMRYMGANIESSLPGMSTMLSEVYRSAYLRVLHFLFMKEKLSTDEYFTFSFETLPIDLSLWKIEQGKCPTWWVELQGKYDSNSQMDTRATGLVSQVTELIKKDEQFKLLALEGPVKPRGDWRNKIDVSISLIGFAYRVLGKDFPNPKEVAREIIYNEAGTLNPRTDRPFTMLESNDFFSLSNPKSSIIIKDLEIYPLVCRYLPLAKTIWQWFRYHSLKFGLPVELTRVLDLRIEGGNLNGYLKNGELAFISREWSEGMLERLNEDSFVPFGQYIKMDKEKLNLLLDANHLRIGYIMQTTYKNKKEFHRKVEEYTDYQLIGVSKIII